MGCCELHWSGIGKEQMGSYCECDNEHSGSIKCWETIEWLHDLRPLK
jgi:hypothetical protein